MPSNPEYVVIAAEPEGSTICSLCTPTVCDNCQRRDEALKSLPETDSVDFRMTSNGQVSTSTVAIVSLQPSNQVYSQTQFDEYIADQLKAATRVHCIPAMDANWSGVACSRVRTNLKRLLIRRNRQLPAQYKFKLDSIKKKDAINVLRQIHSSLFTKYFSRDSLVMPRRTKVYFDDISSNETFYHNIQLSEIPGSKITSKQVDQSQKCVICLVLFKKGELVKELGCHHIFHPQCISTWSDEKNTCPYCRIYMDLRKVVNYKKVKFTPVKKNIIAKVVNAACYASIMLSSPVTVLVSRKISPSDDELRRRWFASRSHLIVKIAMSLKSLEVTNPLTIEVPMTASGNEIQEERAQNFVVSAVAIESDSLMQLLMENDLADGLSIGPGVFSLVFYNP